MVRVICILVFVCLANPSFGQDVEDEYMIELAKELFFGLPIKSDLATSLSFLNGYDQIESVSVDADTVKATLKSHPVLNIHSIKGEDASGSLGLELLFRNNQLFERRIVADHQADLKTFRVLYNLLKNITFHIETKKIVTESGYHREDILFSAKDGRHLAHLELSYNPAFNPESDISDPAKTIHIALAIYDNTLY